MKAEKVQLVRGSGNVFRDVLRENADIEQLKASLAAESIKALDRDDLTVRARPGANRVRRRRFLTDSERRPRKNYG